ncbi:MAG: hypothetical protein NDJ94_20595 [Vicinamibacteria bacterium]|nr:hypothetical protein [Vicinamibacteria bacterium]
MPMPKEAAVWIDHRKAVIVVLQDESEETIEIASGMDKRVRYSGAAEQDGAENQRDRRYDGQLDKFYDEVIARLSGVEAVLIVGPGEARGELEKRFGHHGRSAHVVAVEPADKRTDRQVAALARSHFRGSPRRLDGPVGGDPPPQAHGA